MEQSPEPRPMTPAPLPAAAPPFPTPYRPAPPAALDAIGLLKALRRRLAPAVGLGLLAAALVAGATYFIVPPAKYTARAMLQVASDQPRILLKTGENQSNYETYQRTQLAMLRSRLVLDAVLKNPKVAQLNLEKKHVDPVEWLEKELRVDFANGSEILRIAMDGADARTPTVLVNAVVEAYLDEVVNADVKRRQERATMLHEMWGRYQNNLRAKRDELKKSMLAAGSDDKETRAILQRSGAERLAQAEEELARNRAELRRLRVEADVLERAEGVAVAPAEVEARVAKDPEVLKLVEMSQQAASRYHQVKRVTRSSSDPALAKHSKDYAAAQVALAQRRKELAPIVAEQIRREGRGGASKLEALRERIEVLSGLEGLLADDVRRLTERGASTTRAAVDVFSIQEEIAYADEVAKRIGAEVEALNVELQAPPRVVLRERAEEPRTKDELRQFKVAGLAGLGSFAAVLAAVAFLEFHTRRVDSADEVVRGLGVRLVGTLPALPRGRRAGKAEAWDNLMVESVDAARTALLYAARTESVRAVMVASALGGEGKTSLACHLAASLARAGRWTLLVDCDLRRPSAHELLGVDCGPGVCEVLRGEVGLDEAVRPTEAAGLDVLTAGACDAEAIAALARDEFAALFQRARGRYDFIIVDSSPVLPVADALLVAQHVDAVLYAVLRDVSRLPKLRAAHERLSALGVRSLGAVVAGTRHESYGGKYDYYSTTSRAGDRA